MSGRLRLRDAIKLGHTSVRAHKLRSVAVVVTISIIFGAVMGVNFVLKGLENNLLSYAEASEGREIYVTTLAREASDKTKVRRMLEQYHGDEVGVMAKAEVDNYEYVSVLPQEAVERFLTKRLDEVGSDKLLIIVTSDVVQSWREAEDTIYFGSIADLVQEDDVELVGVIPIMGNLRIETELGKFNLLDTVLDGVGAPGLGIYLIDDGTGRVQEYIEGLRDQAAALRAEPEESSWYSGETDEEWSWRDSLATDEFIVAKFPDVKTAYNYIHDNEEGATKLQAEVLFSSQVSIYRAVRRAEDMLRFLVVALVVVAVIVMAFTFAHLVSLEAPTIALYRSLGATTGDIVMVYLAYLLELCVLAVVFATVLGMLIAGVMTLMYGGVLKEKLVKCYGVEMGGPVILIGFGWKYLEVTGVMLLVAPVAFGLIFDQLSAKKIAQKLKQDA